MSVNPCPLKVPTYVDVVAGVGAAEARHRRHARAADGEHVLLALRMRITYHRKMEAFWAMVP